MSTHILTIESFDRDCIGQIAAIIGNKLIIKEIQDVPLAIRWIPRAGDKLNVFSTKVPFFTDIAVHLHTKELKKDLKTQLKGKVFDFVIMKPITRSVALE